MPFVFAEDSKQANPCRPAMGPLVAYGAILISEAALQPLDRDLEMLCNETGFPHGEEFKWHPDHGTWMQQNLQGAPRIEFYQRAMTVGARHRVKAAVVAVDKRFRPPVRPETSSHEQAAQVLLLERVHSYTTSTCSSATFMFDKPSGNRATEEQQLAFHMRTVSTGTPYTGKMSSIALVGTGLSHLYRPLQLADVITGCVTARVAGEFSMSPPVFDLIRPLLWSAGGRVGGVGLKLNFLHSNLLYWLLGDTHVVNRARGNLALPCPTLPHFDPEDC